MPDVNAIGTYFFAAADGGKDGWSENWYISGSDLPACLDKAKKYVQPRRGPLSKFFFIEAVRVSDVLVLGDSLEATYDVTETRGLRTESSVEPAEVCILFRFEAGAGRRRILPLHGIPGNQLNADGTLALTDAYRHALDNYESWWAANVGLLRMRRNDRSAGSSAVITVNGDDNRSIKVLPAPAIAGLAKKDTVLVSGVPQDKGFGYNGKWIVADIADSGLVTMAPKRKHYLMGSGNGNTVSKLLTTFPEITRIQRRRGGRRKVGRPFDSSRGRLSATRH